MRSKKVWKSGGSWVLPPRSRPDRKPGRWSISTGYYSRVQWSSRRNLRAINLRAKGARSMIEPLSYSTGEPFRYRSAGERRSRLVIVVAVYERIALLLPVRCKSGIRARTIRRGLKCDGRGNANAAFELFPYVARRRVERRGWLLTEYRPKSVATELVVAKVARKTREIRPLDDNPMSKLPGRTQPLSTRELRKNTRLFFFFENSWTKTSCRDSNLSSVYTYVFRRLKEGHVIRWASIITWVKINYPGNVETESANWMQHSRRTVFWTRPTDLSTRRSTSHHFVPSFIFFLLFLFFCYLYPVGLSNS